MSESIENQIFKAISNYKRGKIFFPSNFVKFGSTTAVRQALNRIEKKGVLIRLAHGIYLYPKKHKLLGNLKPSIDEIALAIAKRDTARIIPTGLQALNKLGLSTQVPMRAVYFTDGTPRVIKVDRNEIKFKIASPKLLSAKSEITILVILALREIGKENLNKETISKILKVLSKVQIEDIKHDLRLAPSWIVEFLKTAVKDRNYEKLV